jgi:hypothetical protein
VEGLQPAQTYRRRVLVKDKNDEIASLDQGFVYQPSGTSEIEAGCTKAPLRGESEPNPSCSEGGSSEARWGDIRPGTGARSARQPELLQPGELPASG